MATIIGLTGRKRAGKDTAAQRLVEEYGFIRIAFADPIREMVATLNPIIVVGEDAFGAPSSLRVQQFLEKGWTSDDLKDRFPLYREFMQRLGTECVRKYDPEFWVNAALVQMTDPDGRYVVTDCRFPNEADGLRARRFAGDDVHVWNIQNDVAEQAPIEHDSEKWAGNLDEDRVLHNNLEIADLWSDIDELALDLSLSAPVSAAA
jgi:hypothetical protein